MIAFPLTGSRPNSAVFVPLSLRGAIGLRALEMSLTYNPAVLRFKNIIHSGLTHDWEVISNASELGRIRTAPVGPQLLNTSDDTLLLLEFEVVGAMPY
jgi:hypothetical protein